MLIVLREITFALQNLSSVLKLKHTTKNDNGFRRYSSVERMQHELPANILSEECKNCYVCIYNITLLCFYR
jgi:hypothetical protein